MGDNDIIKALECCSNEPTLNCRNCPYERACNMGKSDMQRDALDLINRQKAEIERLTYYNENLLCANSDILGRHEHYIKEAKSEAIKEFAERIEPELANNTEISSVGYQSIIAIIINLVKEMTEETKHE